MSQDAKTIYFLATLDHSMVKIGITRDILARLNGYQTASPVPLKLLGSFSGTDADEWKLQAYYIARHSHGEWFYATPQMLAEIKEMEFCGHMLARIADQQITSKETPARRKAMDRVLAERRKLRLVS